MVEYLRQSSVEAQPVRVPSAETERGNVSFQEQGHRLAQGRRKSDFTGQRRAKFVFKDVKGVTVDVERKKKLEEELKQQESAKDERVGDPMKKLFDQFDTDKSGALDQQEFLQATELMGLSFPRTELGHFPSSCVLRPIPLALPCSFLVSLSSSLPRIRPALPPCLPLVFRTPSLHSTATPPSLSVLPRPLYLGYLATFPPQDLPFHRGKC